MTPAAADALRRAAAHVLVDDVAAPALDEQAEHHVFRVLRVRDGQVVTVTDGTGNWRVCRAVAGAVEAVGDARFEPAAANPLTIGFAVPKQDRPEWIVQKLTEIGVANIVVLHAERSVVRWDTDRGVKHLVKLVRVAREAVQQSRQVWLPRIDGPVAATEFVPGAAVAEPGGRSLQFTDRVIAVGPEGGWSPAELELAAARVSLGPTVLRVETATLVAASRVVDHAL